MGIEQLQQELVDQGAKEEKTILDAAHKQESELVKQAQAHAERVEAKASKELATHATIVEKKEAALRESQHQKAQFEAQAQALDQVYAQSYEQIVSSKGKKREEFLTKLLEQAEKEIPVATVFANATDAKLIKSKATIKTKDMDGGIICENKQGTMRVDLRFETLFAQTKKHTLQEVTKTLFA